MKYNRMSVRRKPLKPYTGPSSSLCASWPTNLAYRGQMFDKGTIQQCACCGALTNAIQCEYCR
jgi:hypothetical protein